MNKYPQALQSLPAQWEGQHEAGTSHTGVGCLTPFYNSKKFATERLENEIFVP